jgi:hypothetical protein
MINLIPKEEKKKLLREFYFRLVVSALVLLDFCIFVFMVVLLPSYFLLNAESAHIASRLEEQNKIPITLEDKATLDAISELDKRLNLIERSEKNNFRISEDVINLILVKKRGDIQINKIMYEARNNEKIISVNGTAYSRDVLLAFRRALEADPNLAKVDLPISNFVKGSNIQFYLTLVPKNEN